MKEDKSKLQELFDGESENRKMARETARIILDDLERFGITVNPSDKPAVLCDLIEEFEEINEHRSSSRILAFGLLLYKIIESQKEANELAESLESFGSDT